MELNVWALTAGMQPRSDETEYTRQIHRWQLFHYQGHFMHLRPLIHLGLQDWIVQSKRAQKGYQSMALE